MKISRFSVLKNMTSPPHPKERRKKNTLGNMPSNYTKKIKIKAVVSV